jgi:hypothetical protein
MCTLVIWHDNGAGGPATGFTEYSMDEVHNLGGVDAILNKYKSAGVYVESWDVYTHNLEKEYFYG